MKNDFHYKAQMAKAKAVYIDLCEAIKMGENILSGKTKGCKACLQMIERTMHKGKSFFSDVKSIRELALEIGQSKDDKRCKQCIKKPEIDMYDEKAFRDRDLPPQF